MPITAEQIAEARKEGYSDAEILQHYADSQGIDLTGARDEGYSDSEILSHFSGANVAPQIQRQSNALTNPALSGALGAGAGAVYSAKTIPVKAAKALGSTIASRIPMQPQTPSPSTYTTPAGINVEQTPGGMHPGAVGNAQFNVEQQQANKLHQNVPPGFEAKGTSRILTPVGMQEPAAALGGAPSTTRGSSILAQKRAEGWPIVRETAQAVKSAAPAIGGAARNVLTSNPAAGAMAGYNLQEALNRYRSGDTAGAVIGGAGTAASLLPKMKGKAGLIKPIVGLGAAGLNALRGEPESVMEGYSGGGAVGTGLEFLTKALKSGKQLAREAKYVHDIAPTHQFSTPKQLSIQDLQKQKAVLVGVPGDRTLTGHEVRAVNRVPLSKAVEQQGGPLYGLRQQDLGNPYFWASNDAAAIGLQNKARRAQDLHGGPVFGLYTAMAPEAGNYALHTTETLLNQIPALNPRKKDIAAFDKIIRQKFPSFAGVTDPDVLEQLARDSKMRKFLAERLNKTTVAEQFGMPSGEATIHAITEPALRDVPTGNTGFAVGRLSPEKELTPNIDVTHGTYNTNIPGNFEGQMIAQVPWQMYFPDAAKQIASNPNQAPHAWGTFKMGDYNQPVTQELVDRIAPIEESILASKKNMAEGGEVKNMAQGKLTGGLGMLPMSARTELRKRGQLADRQGIPAALAMPDQAMVNAYNSAPADLAKLAAMYAHPMAAAGMGGGQMLQGATEGDTDAMLSGGLGMLGLAGSVPKGIRAARGVANTMMQNPRAPSMADRMYSTGAADDHLQAVPAMAGGGSAFKNIMADVVEPFLAKSSKFEKPGLAADIVPGAPHTYPPQVPAGTQWMQDYVPQSMAQTATQSASPTPQITYMGKYRRGTPEERAMIKAQEQDALRSIVEGRKQQWLQRSREMGMTDEEIAAEMNSPWGAPWMPR